MEGMVMEEYNLDGIIALCKEKEEKLNLAGEYGLKLQEELQECQRHMEEMRIQHETQVESMIQQIYELKIKLESMEKSMVDEKMIMKQTVDDCNISKERLISESNEKENLIKKEKASALAQLNQVQLRERQLNEKVVQLEEKNANLMAERQKKREEANVSYSQEVFVLHEKIINLEDVVDNSNAEIITLRNETETLSLSLQTLQTELTNKQSELEVAERKSTAFFNHLEKSREETSDVKSELDLLKMKLKQSGHQKKGNSLFGEVEDERMVMEKKLRTMEIKYESLQKAYAFLKSQHHNLKSQVTALLSLHSGKADLDHINNLERALSQLKSENAELVNKLKVTQVNESAEVGELKDLGKNLPNFESNKDVVEFLSIKLEESKGQLRKLREELDQTHMFKMAESDKLLTAEQKLHDTGISAEKYKNANMKLRLKLEETENKFKAENQKRILVEKKFNYDSSNDVEPIGISSQTKLKSPPPSIKREQKKFNLTKLHNGNGRKLNSKEKVSSELSWGEVLKTLQKVEGKKKGSVFQENNIGPTFSNDIGAAISNDRKVSFKDDADVFLSTEKENDCEVEVTNELKPELIKNPSSCLKKANAGKSVFSVKESSCDASKEQKVKSNGVKVRDDQSCDVQ